MVISDRDSEIMASIADLRFMTTYQIHLLHGYDGIYGLKVTRRKLQELERKGWLKSWQPSKYEQKIYYLSKCGAKELEYQCGLSEVKTYRKSEKTLHQAMISEVIVQCKIDRIGTLRLFQLNKRISDIVPDAYIEYERNAQRAAFFLEVDRNTESVLYIREVKLDKYRDFYHARDGTVQQPVLFIVVNSHYRKNIMLQIISQYVLPAKCCTLEEFITSPSVYLEDLVQKYIAP